MKKICLFLWLVCCVFAFNTAFADVGCMPTDCSQSAGNDKISSESLTKNKRNTGTCYICEHGFCEDGNIVYDKRSDTGKVCHYGKGIFMSDDKWQNYTVELCPNALSTRGEVQGSTKVYYIDGKKEADRDLPVAKGTVCYRYECPDGQYVDDKGLKCVSKEPQKQKTQEKQEGIAACVKTDSNGKQSNAVENEQVDIACEKGLPGNSMPLGDLASDGALHDLNHVVQGNNPFGCYATCRKDGWYITLKNKGCVAGYEPDTNHKVCKETAGTKAEREKRERAINAKNCSDSGGTWNDGTGCTCNKPHMKDLDKGKTCQCESDAYVFNKDKHVCEITDLEQLKQNCERAAKNSSSGVEGWDGVSKCICKQSNEMYNFDGVSKCVQDERYKLCAAKPNEAYWKHDEEKCVCIDKDFEWMYNRCDKKGEVIIAENEANATGRVQSLVKGLKEKFATFEKSVWKDKEGNFNKARLASDSIAGVVLGTAGGLITSHVVKKSQIKSGFEDIQCTVGGQKVADWGDEFTVGIK